MQNYQILAVFCSNISCGTDERREDERQNVDRRDIKNVKPLIPTILRSHRRMEYRGSRKGGLFERPGWHHHYECPVCGREVIYYEKDGVAKRVSA